jgi:regulator of protease activity HflC (stomatin/prohibitin superfamily)
MKIGNILRLAGGALIVVALMGSWYTVESNKTVVVTRFGQFSHTADPGFNFKIPFVDAVQEYRTDIQELRPAQAVNTYTVDNQEVDIVYTVFYRVPADKVQYINANNRDYKARLDSMVVDRLKTTMGSVNVQSVAEKRGQLRDAIKETIVASAAPLGIEVTDFQLTDLEYTKAFREAVNNAAVQKANVESFEYQRQQAQKSAETAAINAEGTANAVRAKAKGDADARTYQAAAEAKAIELQGNAEASAIQAQASALKANPELVNLRKAERWDGKLPTAVYAGAPIPFLPADK